MKLAFSLLPLLSLLSLLTIRHTIRHTFIPPPPSSSILQLASTDPYSESTLKTDIESILSGNLPSSNHPTTIWRTSAAALRRPELRRSVLNWWRNRLIFHPDIISNLTDLVKTPLDQHSGNNNNHPNRPRHYPSCAVIGNSGILLNSNHGDLIDGHDLVIRLNNAPIDGHRRDVGSRTNLSFVNSNVLHLCASRPNCFCHPYGENVPIITYVCQAVHFLDHAVCESEHKSPLLITDARFDLLCGRIAKYYSVKRFVEEKKGSAAAAAEDWGRYHDAEMFHYSSGMQAVVLALGICERVSVFGFGKLAGRHHYHTNQKSELDLHDYEAEYEFYRDLVERPEEIPFLRDSGFRLPPFVLYR